MTVDDIVDKLRLLGDGGYTIEGGRVWYSLNFTFDADETDAGQVAWDTYIDLQERMYDIGLMMVDFSSDNDSVSGRIVDKRNAS